jgi:hypothetical protein
MSHGRGQQYLPKVRGVYISFSYAERKTRYSFNFLIILAQETESWLQRYYRRGHNNWNQLIPYNEFWAILAFISNKACIYVWNYTDVLIGIFARAIYMKFRKLHEAASEVFSKDEETGKAYEWDIRSQSSNLTLHSKSLCETSRLIIWQISF